MCFRCEIDFVDDQKLFSLVLKVNSAQVTTLIIARCTIYMCNPIVHVAEKQKQFGMWIKSIPTVLIDEAYSYV
jgi:hypothetical protein